MKLPWQFWGQKANTKKQVRRNFEWWGIAEVKDMKPISVTKFRGKWHVEPRKIP